MIDSYIILNRKTNLIIKSFIFNICIIIALIIWGINTFEYQSYFHIHSKLLYLNSYYLMEVLIPEKEVNQIIKEKKLLIGDKSYSYSVYEISDNIIYEDNINYRRVYLDVSNLEDNYKVNNYRLEIKILKDKKKIVDYLKK